MSSAGRERPGPADPAKGVAGPAYDHMAPALGSQASRTFYGGILVAAARRTTVSNDRTLSAAFQELGTKP